MTVGALEGIKVCDFSWVAAGPIITKYLADFGATVVRIESVTNPDMARLSSPFKDDRPGLNRSAFYPMLNPNKYSLALNLSRPEGVEIAKRWVARSDIVVENFTAGVMDRLGLGYEELRKVKPDIIMLSSSNQGRTGPHARHPGLGLMLSGLSGFYHVTGESNGPPMALPVAYTDIIAPRLAAVVLLAALDYRERTGEGQYIDVSQLEASVHFLASAMLDAVVNGREGERLGNACPHAAPHGAYRCRGDDRWCVIAVESDADWSSLCEAMGRPASATDPRFATLRARKEHEADLNRLVEAWTSGLAPEEVMHILQRRGVAAGVVQSAADLVSDPQLLASGALWELKHSEIGPCAHFGQFVVLSETPATPRMAAPCLGEHTEYVCKQLLGMSDDEFIDLLNLGVLE